MFMSFGNIKKTVSRGIVFGSNGKQKIVLIFPRKGFSSFYQRFSTSFCK